MANPTGKNATFRDLQLPRAKTIQYLTRVFSSMQREVECGPGTVARMEIAEPGVAPHYRFEMRKSKWLVMDGKRHKPLVDDGLAERAITWSRAAMTFHEIAELIRCLISDEIDELTQSD